MKVFHLTGRYFFLTFMLQPFLAKIWLTLIFYEIRKLQLKNYTSRLNNFKLNKFQSILYNSILSYEHRNVDLYCLWIEGQIRLLFLFIYFKKENKLLILVTFTRHFKTTSKNTLTPSMSTQFCIKGLLLVWDFCFWAVWAAGTIHKKVGGQL